MTTRSKAQREASRINGAKSKGPTTPGGKDKVKFNGLKHRLRAEQVVLPGEDPAAFEAEHQAWFDDWNPPSHTRAVLVERAAVASWRLRRAVGDEAALLQVRAERASRDFDAEQAAMLERHLHRFDDDPAAAVVLLGSHALGIDRMIKSWSELGDALEAGPAAWDQPRYHARLMLLLGLPRGTHLIDAGPMARASTRLLAASRPDFAGTPPTPAEAEAMVADLRRFVDESIGRLRERRGQVADPEMLRRDAVGRACAVTLPEELLRRRYELAIERGLRSTIKQLMELGRTGADLAGPVESEPEPAPAEAPRPEPGPSSQGPTPEAVAPAPGSVGAGDRRPPRRRPEPRERLRESRQRAAKRPRKGGSNP